MTAGTAGEPRAVTGRHRGRPPKAAEARSPLRGRGSVRSIVVAPAALRHRRLLDALRELNPHPAIALACEDAPWLAPVDFPAVLLAHALLRELDPEPVGAPTLPPAPEVEPTPAPTDTVGTVPAFPELGGVSLAPRTGAPPSSKPPTRELAPMLIGLLAALGLLPEARHRMNIQLVEDAEPPAAPTPARLPRASR